MVLVKINHKLSLDFSKGAADLNKDVFIYSRKQIGQKREGFGASQL
jgi:hypothetical protein